MNTKKDRKTNKPPETIFLQWHKDGDQNDFGEVCNREVTWAAQRIFPGDVEYVRVRKKTRARWCPSRNLSR